MARQQIGANIKRLRRERDWTQDQLAEKVGLSRSGLGEIERGNVDTAASTLQAIADELGVQIGAVTGERSTGPVLSKTALSLGAWFDALEHRDQSYVLEYLQRTFGFAPSSR